MTVTSALAPSVEASVAARRIEADGTSEACWQTWPGLAAIEQRSLSDWVPPSARLVVVAPHPDDEVLGCGGLLRLHAARGGACLIVGVTDGEASHGASAAWPASRLASARRLERLGGLRALGLDDVALVRLELPDGGVAHHESALAPALRGLLSADDRVVTTWQLDGHPDHEACGRAADEACAAIGCRLLQAPVWMWHWARPDDPRVPWHRLRGLRLPAEVVAAKQRALAAHATQLGRRDLGNGVDEAPVLGADMRERAGRDTEFFFV